MTNYNLSPPYEKTKQNTQTPFKNSLEKRDCIEGFEYETFKSRSRKCDL